MSTTVSYLRSILDWTQVRPQRFSEMIHADVLLIDERIGRKVRTRDAVHWQYQLKLDGCRGIAFKTARRELLEQKIPIFGYYDDAGG